MNEKEEIRLTLLQELRGISYPNKIIREIQKNKTDGDYIIEMRECAMIDWNFAYVGALCEDGCKHDHDRKWQTLFKNSLKSVRSHREIIENWLHERCPEGKHAEPSDCEHFSESGEEIN